MQSLTEGHRREGAVGGVTLTTGVGSLSTCMVAQVAECLCAVLQCLHVFGHQVTQRVNAGSVSRDANGNQQPRTAGSRGYGSLSLHGFGKKK
jgi:hypothetical protein